MKLRHWILLALTGCATPDTPIEPWTELPAKRNYGIAWMNEYWRICDAGDTCFNPTPKTRVNSLPAHPNSTVSIDNQKHSNRLRPASPVIVNFSFGQSNPKTGMNQLEEILKLLQQQYTNMIRIEGYTDSTGSLQYNKWLARSRAESVAAWLKSRGIHHPVTIEARGKCCYKASNDTEAGRAMNRRVEVHF
ncbi:MAG: OmpA family protein [Nitrosomonas sp.]|uniref:OmpA family protein n=1 Tax=Nitrosomonas aestuarii TaxID=52441 RepID=A0A1I4DII5_9PROT|nr:OmpA family protein [Nitrosomonas aestuarii]MBX3630306.1 OmpA family protein [Nitrosomonas sp.]SFK93458.1 OmpA family protein [Nitrosomonas aestuarii]